MTYSISTEDRIFKRRFESCKFPAAEFNHRAHLRLAYIYLSENDDETAYEKMRGSLHKFLKYNGVDPSKYHETMTRAWVLAVRHFMEKTDTADSADSLIDKNPEMLDTNIMLTHYTAEVLFSDEARNKFVKPDLDPIPRY